MKVGYSKSGRSVYPLHTIIPAQNGSGIPYTPCGEKEPTPRCAGECVYVGWMWRTLSHPERAGDQYKRLARLWPPFCDSPASIPHTPTQPSSAESRRWFVAGSNPRSLLACPPCRLPFPRLPWWSLLVQGYSRLQE